jgi:hypothetical protein
MPRPLPSKRRKPIHLLIEKATLQGQPIKLLSQPCSANGKNLGPVVRPRTTGHLTPSCVQFGIE